MVLADPPKRSCTHHDPRPMSMEKQARVKSAVDALKEKGPITEVEFFTKFEKALARKKKGTGK